MDSQSKHRKGMILSPEKETLAADLIEHSSRWLQEIPLLASKLRSFPPEDLEIFCHYLLEKSEQQVLPLFETLAGMDEVLDMALVRALGYGSSPLSADFLRRWAGRNPAKSLSKEIRKSIFRMKSKGVPVEEVGDSAPGIFHAPRPSAAEGYASAIDATGSRLVWLGKPQMPQGMVTISSLVNDTEGIVDFQAFESSRKKFHEYMDQMRTDLAWEFVKIDPRYGGGLIHEAHGIQIQKGKTPHPEYLKFRNLLEPSYPLPLRPLIYQHLSAEEIRAHSELAARSPSLFQTPSFQQWYLGKEEVQKYITLLDEASQSRIILAPHQREARLFDIYLQAVHELFDEKRRLLFRRRLEEMAYLLWQEGQQAEARVCFAAALDLSAEIKILSPHLFLLELVKRTFIALMGEKQEEKEKEKGGGLIIQP